MKQEKLNCPICGSDVPEDSEFDINKIIASNKAEVLNIDSKVDGLDGLINEILAENKGLESRL